MANEKSNVSLKTLTETIRAGGGPGDDQTIRIINDTQMDALIYFSNKFWGPKSAGYVRVGKSVDLPTNVNIDAYAMFETKDGDTFLYWPTPFEVKVYYNVSKENLTPGQTYHLSDFGVIAGAAAAAG